MEPKCLLRIQNSNSKMSPYAKYNILLSLIISLSRVIHSPTWEFYFNSIIYIQRCVIMYCKTHHKLVNQCNTLLQLFFVSYMFCHFQCRRINFTYESIGVSHTHKVLVLLNWFLFEKFRSILYSLVERTYTCSSYNLNVHLYSHQETSSF